VPFIGPKGQRFALPFDNTSFSTAVAVENPSPTNTLTISETARNLGGQIIGGDTITLPPLGRMTFLVLDRIPATANQRGSVYFTSSPSGMAALGLAFGLNGTFTASFFLTSSDIQ
jgi:hypothetical protein